jgi:hypothetical protein
MSRGERNPHGALPRVAHQQSLLNGESAMANGEVALVLLYESKTAPGRPVLCQFAGSTIRLW